MNQASNILDLSQFPIVRVNIDRRNSGYTQQWIEEMNVLLQRQEPFALIADTRSQSDNPEDEKIRGNWYRQNNDKLAQWCLVMLYVEPDETKKLNVLSYKDKLKDYEKYLTSPLMLSQVKQKRSPRLNWHDSSKI